MLEKENEVRTEEEEGPKIKRCVKIPNDPIAENAEAVVGLQLRTYD